MALKLIGYWWFPVFDEEWPHPKRLVSKWDPSLRRRIADYLRSGQKRVGYCGWSYCRFGCGRNGTIEQTDGVYAWPEGLAHYVEVHSVRLPEAFVEHARAQDFTIPAALADMDYESDEEPYDMTFWREWCRREAPPRWVDRWGEMLRKSLGGRGRPKWWNEPG